MLETYYQKAKSKSLEISVHMLCALGASVISCMEIKLFRDQESVFSRINSSKSFAGLRKSYLMLKWSEIY
jgi:hypothetical protein